MSEQDGIQTVYVVIGGEVNESAYVWGVYSTRGAAEARVAELSGNIEKWFDYSAEVVR